MSDEKITLKRLDICDNCDSGFDDKTARVCTFCGGTGMVASEKEMTFLDKTPQDYLKHVKNPLDKVASDKFEEKE
jgi:DnaJ-class molecular chaperone